MSAVLNMAAIATSHSLCMMLAFHTTLQLTDSTLQLTDSTLQLTDRYPHLCLYPDGCGTSARLVGGTHMKRFLTRDTRRADVRNCMEAGAWL